MATTKEIILGSGKLYAAAKPNGDINALSTYCTEANQIGWISGGCAVSYVPQVYTVKDDLGMVFKRFITSEECTIKSGILTWNLETLKMLVNNETASTADGVTTVKIGAHGFNEMDEYIIVFEHTEKDKVYRVGMVGTSDAGLTLNFAADKECVVDATFTAVASDDNGTLLIIEYEKKQ